MTGREQAIGAALAAVLVIGVIDATAGHNGSSTSTPSGAPTGAPTMTPSPSTAPTATASAASPHPHRSVAVTASSSGLVVRHIPTSPASPSARSASPAPSSSSPAATRAGVLGTFRYATTGYETTNIPGTRRTYPSTTKIVNKLKGCGVQSTWKPVSEHVQKQLICPASGGSLKIRSYTTSISFYGVTSGEHFTCAGPSYVYRPNVAVGTVWRYRCKSADAVASQKAKVVGYQTINVGGTQVRTLHVHLDITVKGSSSGTSSQDYWIATSKPVLVKEAGTVAASQKNVRYTSTYSLALKSLSPRT